jgi:bis(5'-nucleosidyl)-tetraphosphatase
MIATGHRSLHAGASDVPRPFNPNEVSAGGVVVRRAADGHEVCLIDDGRYWGLPKGNVAPGESPEAAALREIEEEVGLDARRLRILTSLPASEYVYRRGGRLIFKRVHHFLVEAPAGAPVHADEHEVVQAEWLRFAAAVERASFRDTVRALEEAQRVLQARDAEPPPGEP